MRQINRLLFYYLLALSILLGSVTTTLIITDRLAGQLELDAAKINMSGRQRMLSQRIIYLAQDLADVPTEDTRAELTQTITQFEAGIDLFAGTHDQLSKAPEIEPALAALYFTAKDGLSLDDRVRGYIRLARQIAQTPSDPVSLAELKQIERGGLLRDLDSVVSEIEAISVSKVDRMRQIESASLIIAIVIVLIEIFVVFLPGHRMIRGTLDDLNTRNQELEHSRRQIDEQNSELWRSNQIVTAERARLNDALGESEALRREQAEFTYSVSHDLKSPANTVRMVLEEIEFEQGDKLSPDAREMLEHGQETILRMGEQIEDVLAYAWSTGTKEDAGEVDLRACAAEALSDLRAEIEESGARIEIGPMATIPGYRKQLRTLIQNLVSNAVKYRVPGATPHVEVACAATATPGEFRLTVSDNGIGIDPDHQDRVFGLFQRLHRRDEYPGSGLGLCTCLRIAQNHDGRIELSSALGEGATFSVTLRLNANIDDDDLERIAA